MKITKRGKKYLLDFRFKDRRCRITGFETEKHSRGLAGIIQGEPMWMSPSALLKL